MLARVPPPHTPPTPLIHSRLSPWVLHKRLRCGARGRRASGARACHSRQRCTFFRLRAPRSATRPAPHSELRVYTTACATSVRGAAITSPHPVLLRVPPAPPSPHLRLLRLCN